MRLALLVLLLAAPAGAADLASVAARVKRRLAYLLRVQPKDEAEKARRLKALDKADAALSEQASDAAVEKAASAEPGLGDQAVDALIGAAASASAKDKPAKAPEKR